MNRNTDIWLGDLMRCWEALAPADDATRAALARTLGFEWRPAADRPPPLPTPTPPVAPGPAPAARRSPLLETPEAIGDELTHEAVDLPLAEQPLIPDASLREWQAIEALERYDPGDERTLPALPTLFRPEWARTITTTLASRRLAIGPIDEESLIRRVAGGRPIARIPRLPRWTLTLGVQLLIDVAPGMESFAGDQIELSERFDESVGTAHLEQGIFCDHPLRGLLADGDLLPYRPPQPGVPVIAVTDLGLGGPTDQVDRARPAEWLAMASLLAARGSPLVVLTPWPRERIPPVLHRHIALIEWDRPTSASRVRHLLERIDG